MKVDYNIRVEVTTNDYVATLGEINDVLQDHLKGNPKVTSVNIYIPRTVDNE